MGKSLRTRLLLACLCSSLGACSRPCLREVNLRMPRPECCPPGAQPIEGRTSADVGPHAREDELLTRLESESDWRAATLALSSDGIDTAYVIDRMNDRLWASMSERRAFDGSSQVCAADPACRIRLAARVLAGRLRERAGGFVAAFFELALRDEGEVSLVSWKWDIVKLGQRAVPFLRSKVYAYPGQTDTARVLAMGVLSRMAKRGIRVDQAVASVRDALKDPDWLIRNAAVGALGAMVPDDPGTV